MRLTTKTLLATIGCLAATMAPAHAVNPWFASAVQTSLDNGIGPGPAPRGSTTADFNSDGKPDIVTITDFTQATSCSRPATETAPSPRPVRSPAPAGVRAWTPGT